MFLILSFLLLFFQNIHTAQTKQPVPSVAQVEAAVADFKYKLEKELGNILLSYDISKDVQKFRKKLVDMYILAWIDKIDAFPVRQRINGIELSVFNANIDRLVKEFKESEQIPDFWNYQYLLDHYKRKLQSEVIHVNDPKIFENEVVLYLVNRLVDQQMAMPSEKGQEILTNELLRQISTTKLVENLKTELIAQEFQEKLNQKFLY
ncbi:hypothetical protein KBB68_03615 [Candidatus Babeliales bacterium]|nr:hypothetical protein [Candidatus Babeliales bacterium]